MKPQEATKNSSLCLTIRGENLPPTQDLGQIDDMKQIYEKVF
jgi:hypothetical protein